MYSNRLNLPAPIVRAITNDRYNAGDSDITVTSLLSPPRAVALLRDANPAALKLDVADRQFALWGQMIHALLEDHAKSVLADTLGVAAVIYERRFFTQILGWKVSGQIDLCEGQTLWDYKTISVYEANNGLRPEREAQLNMLAYLMHMNNVEVDELKAVGLIRDWRPAEAKQRNIYPESSIVTFDVPLWDHERTHHYMMDLVAEHQKARRELPQCSDEERWAVPDKIALHRKGRRTAIRLYNATPDGIAELEQAMDPSNPDLYTEVRHGEPAKRCGYCDARNICAQYAALMHEEARHADATESSAA